MSNIEKEVQKLSIMKFSLFVGCVAVSILAAASEQTFDSMLDEDWKNWKSEHEKQYTEGEESYRRMIWEDNMRFIKQHNLEHSMGKYAFTVGMNQFGDLTNKEFNELMNGFRPVEANNANEVDKFDADINDEESDEDENDDYLEDATVDWREKGYVNPVENQGQCGSCWAFSATGAIEGQWFAKTNKLVRLSEQQLIDCSRLYRNAGCNGGWMSYAFEYIVNSGGISSAEDYQYVAEQNCTFMKNKIAAKIRHYAFVIRTETYLKRAVARIGPISVAIDAKERSFQFYRQGVYDSINCSAYSPNHAVLVVGFGRMDNKNYWLVKNSWGTSWGDQGYIKIIKSHANICGILNYAVYPIV
ncbi:procathepsin L-like isoform X2 [Rhincodon typus]|uniref:procathepsin L-like isoform X2 n=1 Tax=Rhincodon typus TaxID=259920 RepID=UPI002030D29C|nr:procathepsin L-like isoform X2 [Rhincodon typus]